MVKENKTLPNKMISGLFLGFFRWYLRRIFSLQVERNDTLGLVSPYLVIGNHANFWDGVLVNLFIKDPICFLVSDEYFRKPLLGWLLRIEGSIPKKKFLVDFSAIKEALKAKSAGRIIGIFPAGKRNWDGSTEEVVFATAKLIKMLNVPVVRALLKGSYLTFPRWARFIRKGKISFSYDLILTPKKIAELSVEDIYREITESLSYREYDYQRTAMNIYQGKNLAERLELYLFLCPECHQIGSLRSRGDIFSCQSCGYEVKYNQYGFFSSEKQHLYFDNPDDWNQWQISWVKDFLKKSIKKDSQKVLIQDKGVYLTRIIKQKILDPIKRGQLFLKETELLLETGEMGMIHFELGLIRGINVQYNDRFEFYYKDQLYQFRFDDPSISAYKWYKIIKVVQTMFLI
jgi:1-acyl-sn-glycerol-3-phosphate acyltransferase